MENLFEVNFNNNSKLVERVFAKSEDEARQKIYSFYDSSKFEITKISKVN